ncbi:MAG: chemotaxis protein CheW [Faecalibacterium sp.]|nr:chemotaxis protein CheW [Faecalibacterium sp.]
MENAVTAEAQHDELEDRFLLFHIDKTLYGLPLTVVLEILNMQKVTPLPKVADYVKGVINLRGKIVPVVDLRLRLGLPARAYDDMTSIIILEMHDTHVGLIVDNVREVSFIPEKKRSAPPSSSKELSAVVQWKGEILQVLDAEVLFAEDLKLAHPKSKQSQM